MKFTQEDLILNKVKRHFDGTQVLFEVDSVNENYNNVLIYESDIIVLEIDGEKVEFVKYGDIGGDKITKAHNKKSVEETPALENVAEDKGDTYEVVVTENDLKNHPELKEEGVKAGEVVSFEKEEIAYDLPKETELKKASNKNASKYGNLRK